MRRSFPLYAICVFISAWICFSELPAVAQKPEPEYIAWTWNVKPKHPEKSLPNVLLEGDSLTRNYFPEVRRRLQGEANVYLMANSYSSGDPRLAHEIVLFAEAEHVQFKVVHFNNGMHAPDFSEEQYRQGFQAYLQALKKIAPSARFIWATTTPVKEDLSSGLTNARINQRNAIARKFVDGMLIDDQHRLMEQHQDLYQDNIHFKPEGADMSGKQAAQMILTALQER